MSNQHAVSILSHALAGILKYTENKRDKRVERDLSAKSLSVMHSDQASAATRANSLAARAG